ncbi:hypothetical protein B0H34DRAFT_724643 [Crassisporium funariophilum]|nr:hypothetical protein B0H34DRAFT_724643 [Crassisporium funariophilum]
MWILFGPFDGEPGGDLNFQKPKLLKTNKTYTVGRKERPLVVSSKKISSNHCEFEVGNYTVDDVVNPSSRPCLKIFNLNKTDKSIRITREGQEELVTAYPSTSQDLQDGDVVSLITGVLVTVKWEPLCAYSAAKLSNSLEVCTSLGIQLAPTPTAEVTHHLTSSYIATLPIATSLLSLCRFVRPEWLHEVIRLGTINSDSNTTILEDKFDLPLISKYRPTFASSLHPAHKRIKQWEPNEERVKLFKDCRFICLNEKIRESDSELRDTIHRGDGSLESFDIHSGVAKFHKALTRSQAKEGKTTVIIGDTEAMVTAIGSDVWGEFVTEAKTYGLDILPSSTVVEAVLNADVSLLTKRVSKEIDEPRKLSPLPDVISNPLAEEPFVNPIAEAIQSTKPTRTLKRRAASQTASREASVAPGISEPRGEDEEAPSLPRKTLTRRVVGGQPFVTGLNDPSVVLNAVPDFRRKTPPPTVTDLTAPTPARSTKLKRRAGVAGLDGQAITDSQAFSFGIAETVTEPPLKKFRALFDASNPERIDAESPEIDSMQYTPSSQTQTQSETHGRPLRSGIALSSLAVLREEEEESQMGAATVLRRAPKRRFESVDESAEMYDSPVDATGESVPATKKRAVESMNAVGRSGETQREPTTAEHASKPSATVIGDTKDNQTPQVSKLDTDAAFLKAIASTRRGKKTEDAFDREFNKLKISKPEREVHEPEKEWGVLAEFGDDTGLRGNFMVVIEMEVYKDQNAIQQKKTISSHSLDRKPNFKKFKKKVVGLTRPKIDLFLNDENDYGMGSSYWRNGNSQSHTQPQGMVGGSQMQSQVKSEPPQTNAKNRLSQPVNELDDEDVAAPARSLRSKPSSRSASALPPTRTTARGKSSAKAKALFLDSDDDIKEAGDDGMDEDLVGMGLDEEQTLRSSAEVKATTGRRTTRTTKPKKPAPTIVDDDSDDEAVFKGFQGRKKGR